MLKKAGLCLSVALLMPFGLVAQSVTLARRGEPAAVTLVRPAQSSPSQVYAAEELQRFTAQLTGVTLPIVTDEGPLPERAVLIGDTRHTAAALGAPAEVAALGEDGFRLVCRPPHLLILGGPVRGTLNGVYEVLERFGGCRWLSSWHSVIPSRETLEVPTLDETQRPAFAMREPFWFDLFNGDFAARNKANGNSMRLQERHGGNSFRFGGGLFCHTFNVLCPPDEFFAEHPEYFSEVNGRRIKDHTQLCLTHPDVLRIVTERLLARIRKDPKAKLFSVSQNDWRNPCTCPACRAIDEREGSHAGTLITFVNQVAEAVEKEFPDVWIETLAYQYTRKPPKTVRPRRNVVPRLCTIECDFSRPLTVSDFKENRSFVEDIRGWSAISKTLFIWDYTTNFRLYIAPFPNVRALQENVRFFRDNHVIGLFEQGAYQGRHADFAELKGWLLAKWLWNPELPAEPLLKTFFEGYYGAAAPQVRQYFDEVHGFYGVTTNAPLRIFDDVKAPIIPDEFYVRAEKLWQQAEAAVQDSPAHLYNVRMGAVPVLAARLARLPTHEPKKVWVTSDPMQHAVPAEHRRLAKELLTRFGEAKNKRLSEGAESHERILETWRFLSGPGVPPAAEVKTSATVEDTALSLGNRGTWGDTVADPLAEDGSAMKLNNTHYEWCTTLRFSQVAFDPGARYRIRMRVRVEKKPGQTGEAFWSGVYDAKNRRSCGDCARAVEAVGEGYHWYNVTEWVRRRTTTSGSAPDALTRRYTPKVRRTRRFTSTNWRSPGLSNAPG